MAYPDLSSRSKALFDRAAQVLPDSGSRSSIRMAPYTPYLAKAQGKFVTDVDGNEYFDFNNNFTSLIHGHAHPRIIEAVSAQLGNGTAFGFVSETEIALAELLCNRSEGFELIRFCNSGTEAVMNAIKAARAFTGRAKIAKCENFYHGSYESAEVSLGVATTDLDAGDPPSLPYSYGTPQGVLNDVVVIPSSNPERARTILDQHADQLACVLFDPIGPGLGRYPPSSEFLDMLTKFRDDSGVLLAFDEVVAFRAGYGGAQGEHGIAADLTALGKIIGGGFPVGAVAGRRDVMSVFEARDGKARLPHGGTFNANPVTMVAGHAAMSMLDRDAFARLDDLGEQFRAGLREALALTNTAGDVLGQHSVFALDLHDDELNGLGEAPRGAHFESRGLHNYLMQHGYFTSSGIYGALSTIMDSADVDPFCQTVVDGIRRIKGAV